MPLVKERRIYRSSKSSLAVTLPSGWVRGHGLKAGDKVLGADPTLAGVAGKKGWGLS